MSKKRDQAIADVVVTTIIVVSLIIGTIIYFAGHNAGGK